MKHKKPMPRFYGRNIVQHVQKKFFQRKALETEKKRLDNPVADVESSKKR